jgi:hypothetical protein
MGLENVKVSVTVGDLEEFKKSLIWRDMKRELLSWKKGFEREMKSIVDNIATTNPSSAQVLTHLGDIHGRTKAVDYMLSLPDIFIQILESEQKSTEVNQLQEEITDGD